MFGDDFRFLSAGGETAQLIAALDWGATSLGPIGSWPEAMRFAVATALRAPVPMALFLGPDGIMVYNDHYIPIAGLKHPGCLGRSVLIAWPEVGEFNANVMRTVFTGGTLSYRDQELTLMRNGVEEQVWLNLDYSPVPDSAGGVVGVLVLITETTEKVRFERTLADERERLRQMFEQAPSFMALLSGPEHVYELTNAAYRRLIGQRDVVGLPVREGLPELTGQGLHDVLDRVYREGEPFIGSELQVSFRPRSGAVAEERTLDFIYQPVLDQEGEVSAIFVEGVDVTDRIEAERARAASELQFRIFAEAMPNHVWVVNAEGEHIWLNNRALEYAGASLEEWLGFGWRSTIHPDDLPGTEKRWRRSMETGEPYEGEYRLRRHDGVWRWHLARAVLIPGAAGRWIGTNTDIEDQKRTEEALRESELRLRLAQEAAGIASVEVDIAAGQVLGSDALWPLWGLPRSKSLPVEVFEELVVPEDRGVRSNDANRRDGSAPTSAEYRIRRADTGEERWLSRHVEFVRDEQGHPVRMFGVLRDITEAKQAEFRQQVLTHELAHRIKNILATVSAIASRTLRDNDLETAKLRLEQRLQALGRAHDILNQSRWNPAPLRSVVTAALAPFPADRMTVEGPDVLIGPRRALSLSLAVNELGTNSLKYGALSCSTGRVAVKWSRVSGEEGPELVWTWIETGGPAVASPTRSGFGRFLIERVLGADFGGEVRIDFHPEGVQCLMRVPWPTGQD